jgi:Gram-negative porin
VTEVSSYRAQRSVEGFFTGLRLVVRCFVIARLFALGVFISTFFNWRKNLRNINIITAAALLAMSGAASALDFSANIELDNTFASGNQIKGTNDEGLTQSGRVEFNASGKAGANMFVAGKMALEAKKSSAVETADMWVQLGNQSFDVKLGRFEAVDLFPLPGDTVVGNAKAEDNAGNVIGSGLNKNRLRGRFGDNDFHGALTLKLGGGLAVEVGLIETKTAGETKGVRPVLTYANGPLSVGLGLDSGREVGGDKFNDFGAFAQYDFGGFKVTGNFAQQKNKPAGGGASADNTAFALVGSFGPANLGFISAKNELGAADEKQTTIYGSYTLPLFDIKGASITPAFTTSSAKLSGFTTQKQNAVRVRINYTF